MNTTVMVVCVIASLSITDAFVMATSNKLHSTRVQAIDGTSSIDTSNNIVREMDESTYFLFPGGGIFFYWQAGVVTYLREQGYNLDIVRLGGASAGALTATLTATNVDFYHATDIALVLAKEGGVWDRKEGLQGIWGPMVATWLDQLLPEDAVEKVNNRLSLLVTEVPSFQRNRIDTFRSRRDLIDCNMASVHLPWFLDGKLTSSFRGTPHIDGSFLISVERDFGVTSNDRIIMPSFHEDPSLDLNVFDFVKTFSPDSIYDFIHKGKAHAKVMEEMGQFESMTKR